MNVLIVGGGGREHAIAWKIAQSPRLSKLYCAPGNPGIAKTAECVDVPVKPDFSQLIQWCRDRKIELVVVGPEKPLAEGIVDALKVAGIAAFGPTREGAQLEASKTFAKKLMLEARIPTGAAEWFTNYARAVKYVEMSCYPIVIKASGLAEGKGVTVARSKDEALAALKECMQDRRFGEAGNEVLIEEFLQGEEASLLAFTDGRTIMPMDAAQDHKPIYDGDKGPNTGGMGAYSPAPIVDPVIFEQCRHEILAPCLQALALRGIDYRGIIYAGLMISKQGPRVIEFNCRFGDPETQVLLPRLKTDLLEIMVACVKGKLDDIRLEWHDGAAICVVLASGGYPGNYEKGKVIGGLQDVQEGDDLIVFHAGTTKNAQDQIVTNGGRVLGVTARGADIKSAHHRAYAALKKIHFDNKHYRCDIALKALDR